MSRSSSPRLGRALATFAALLAAGVCGLALGDARSASAQADCQGVAIRSPFAGDVVSGTIEILGSARIAGFQFYKVEWAPESEPESWRAVSSTIDRQVSNGLLDRWDSRGLADGVYRLKLTAVDDQANEVCRMLVAPLWVANTGPAEATPSPSPAPSPTALPRSIAPDTASAETTDAADDAAGDAANQTADPVAGEADGASASDGAGSASSNTEPDADPAASDARVDGSVPAAGAAPADAEAPANEAGPATFVAAMAGAAARAFGVTLLLALLIGGLFVARRRRP